MRKPKGELINDPVVLRSMECIKQNGITEKDMMLGVGLDKGTIPACKYRWSKSYNRYIDRIADYLGVSPKFFTRY